MKPKRGALILVGGAVAVTLFVLQHREIARLRRMLTLAALGQETAMVTGRGQPAASAHEESAVTNAPKAFDWLALESSDYRRYIANLRAAGCPEQTIRDLIITDLDRSYRQRIAKLH